jgi:ubiquitin carboxyl-terminal hydrolase 8
MNDIQKYSNRGLSGIINIGNTCYLNSALQCLSNIIPLTEYFLSGKFVEDFNKDKKESYLCIEYVKLLKGLWEENCIIKPISFKKVLENLEKKFVGYNQHDSQEVIIIILEILHNSLSYEVNISYDGIIKNEWDRLKVESIKIWEGYFKKQYSYILELFYGQYYSNLECQICQKSTNNFDPFSIITLQITDKCENIYDCFNEFCKKEILDTNNTWKCDNCKQYSNAIKTIKLWKLPNILMIVLKRFEFNSSKINKTIYFPLNDLDISNYVEGYEKNNAKYDAFGIINHSGFMGYGHYNNYCKNMNNKWYLYDDQDVEEVNEINIKNTYVIFYAKK